MSNEFQYRLQKALASSGLTASELSEKSGISEANISNYINGKYVAKQDKCYQLASSLGVDPGWLMTGDEPRRVDIIKLNMENKAGDYDPPKTEEARILSKGIDKLDPDQRAQALAVVKAMFAQHPELFDD